VSRERNEGVSDFREEAVSSGWNSVALKLAEGL
jgi:hypothetical protein